MIFKKTLLVSSFFLAHFAAAQAVESDLSNPFGIYSHHICELSSEVQGQIQLDEVTSFGKSARVPARLKHIRLGNETQGAPSYPEAEAKASKRCLRYLRNFAKKVCDRKETVEVSSHMLPPPFLAFNEIKKYKLLPENVRMTLRMNELMPDGRMGQSIMKYQDRSVMTVTIEVSCDPNMPLEFSQNEYAQ